MAEALKAAKEAFGSDAVILGVKTTKAPGRFLGKWKKQQVTLTAATDTPHPTHDSVSISQTRPPENALNSEAPAAFGMKKNPHLSDDGRGAIRTFSRPRSPHQPKKILPSSYVKKLFWMQQQMLMGGVASQIVQELMARLHTIAVRKAQVSESLLMNLLEDNIQDRIHPEPDPDTRQRAPKCRVFVGSTGVGKTTTIGKIATIYSHQKKSSVGLITLDEQRVGGMSQLAIYARILGIPIKAAASPIALRKAISAFSGKQLILVDTAGVNPNDPDQIDTLATMLAEIEQSHIHLVLSTTTKSRDLDLIVGAFRPLPIRDLLFTKVDESTTQGSILNQALQSRLPLSYFTDGRDIPDDIHVMTARRLMGMIFNESTLRMAKSASPEILAERLQAFDNELEKLPLALKPYRTFSTRWDETTSGSTHAGYTNMAEPNGRR